MNLAQAVSLKTRLVRSTQSAVFASRVRQECTAKAAEGLPEANAKGAKLESLNLSPVNGIRPACLTLNVILMCNSKQALHG